MFKEGYVASECSVVDIIYSEGLIEKCFDAVKNLSGSYGSGRGGNGCGQGGERLGGDGYDRGLPLLRCMFMSGVLREEV